MQTVNAVEIKTTLDRNPVSMNESFQITFSATESPDDDPDFTPLEKDFDIINQSKSSNSSWINGQSSRSIKWVVNVMPKRPGSLIIPVVSFGDDRSQPATVLVTKSAPTSNNNDEELFLQVEATPQTPYVQSQVLYTLRLYRRVQIAQASLTEPDMKDAIVEKLGEDKNYNTSLNGVQYVVTERKYAIFPQKSGVSRIAPLSLTAEVVTNSRSRMNSFFSRQTTRTKRVMSKAINLDVKPAPADFTGKRWIPSEHLYIEQKWSGDINKMRVGEPLTRTITLLAKGTTVAQLPEVYKESGGNQLKTYPDQPVLKEQKQSDGLIAFREEKIAYIPSSAGAFTLPAIEIPWFNTATETMEIARIPVQTGMAMAVAGPAKSNPVTVIPDQPLPEASEQKEKVIIKTVESKFWMWIALIFACGWLVTLLFLFKKKQAPKAKQSENPQEAKIKDVIKVLKQACKNNDPDEAKNALLLWGKLTLNSRNLSDIAMHSEARLRDEIQVLSQCLYACEAEPWQGKKLYQAFTENNARKKVAKTKVTELEPLYKL